MKLKIGDLVRFVDEAIEGHITSFQANDIIGVTDETGFEIPVPASKVTLVYGSMQSATDREDELPTLNSNTVFVHEGVYLAVTSEQQQGLATFYLVNETSYQLLAAIAQVSANGKVSGVYAGIVRPRTAERFYSANFSNIGKWPLLQVQLLKYTDSMQALQQPISKQIRFRPADISNNPKAKLDTLEEKAWVLQVDKPEEDLKLERLGNWGKLK